MVELEMLARNEYGYEVKVTISEEKILELLDVFVKEKARQLVQEDIEQAADHLAESVRAEREAYLNLLSEAAGAAGYVPEADYEPEPVADVPSGIITYPSRLPAEIVGGPFAGAVASRGEDIEAVVEVPKSEGYSSTAAVVERLYRAHKLVFGPKGPGSFEVLEGDRG